MIREWFGRFRNGLIAKGVGYVTAKVPAQYFMTGHRYKGRPYGYYGFLEKAVRPTNMARRRVKTHALTYSEL